MRNPKDLSPEELGEVVRKIQEALWPDGNMSHTWDSGTTHQIAIILADTGLAPDPDDL